MAPQSSLLFIIVFAEKKPLYKNNSNYLFAIIEYLENIKKENEVSRSKV
jgi:hypothetical protein